MTSERTADVPTRLRAGRKVLRTLYAVVGDEPSDDDRLVGLVDTPELADEIVDLVTRNQQLQEALEAIAADDDLVEANESAFSIHALRRCQTIARAALASRTRA